MICIPMADEWSFSQSCSKSFWRSPRSCSPWTAICHFCIDAPSSVVVSKSGWHDFPCRISAAYCLFSIAFNRSLRLFSAFQLHAAIFRWTSAFPDRRSSFPSPLYFSPWPQVLLWEASLGFAARVLKSRKIVTYYAYICFFAWRFSLQLHIFWKVLQCKCNRSMKSSVHVFDCVDSFKSESIALIDFKRTTKFEFTQFGRQMFCMRVTAYSQIEFLITSSLSDNCSSTGCDE